MMPLLDRVNGDLATAIRARDEVARDTLRMIKADLVQRELELGRALEGPEEIAVLTRAVKTRRDSIAQYEEGGRTDLADKEKAEILVVERYLPKGLSEAEAEAAITALATEIGAEGKKDMGRLMKTVGERYPGQIDGKLAARIAQKVLAS